MWSRRAQEYDQKINSGKIYELAEVVKDLNKNTDIIADQSYSERQLFEKAYERLKSEFEAVLKSNPSNTADILQKNGAVMVQMSQSGGGSPIVRGFEANRVLLVIDGVRLNNAIFRSGHLQNIISTSPYMLNKMDVIFGPASVKYGSDALGGVIHIHTKSSVQVIRYGLSDRDRPLHFGVGQTFNNSPSERFSNELRRRFLWITLTKIEHLMAVSNQFGLALIDGHSRIGGQLIKKRIKTRHANT